MNGTTSTLINRDTNANFLIVDDLEAQSATIWITGDFLSGATGRLKAPGDAEITIRNKSTAYLRTGRLTVGGDSVGAIYFNNTSIDNNNDLHQANAGYNSRTGQSEVASLDEFVVGSTTAAPTIYVENTSTVSPRSTCGCISCR